MGAVIFSGDKTKALLPALGLGDAATIRSGTTDPQTTPTAGNRGDVYVRTGANAKIYQKTTTDGSDTNWALIPSTLTALAASSVLVTDTLGNIKTDGGITYDSATDTLGVVKVNTPSLQRATSGTLAIGDDGNSTTINIGTTGSTINLQGTTVYQNVTNVNVANKQINLNVNGGAGTATNSGIEIQENSIITAYAQTSADRNSWTFLAPNTAGIVTITPGAGGFTINQGSHDPVTLVAVGSSPNANGASLSTQVLTLQPADGTNPGVLTAGTQTIGGAKTFSSTTTVANLIDSGLTVDTVPYANGSKQLTSSVVSSTELGYLSGVTSAIQTQLNNKANTALSNLTTTSINQNLIFNTGSTAIVKTQDSTGTTKALSINTGDVSSSGGSGNITISSGSGTISTGAVTVISGAGASGANTGVAIYGSSDATGAGNSGNVSLGSGNIASGTGGTLDLFTGSSSGSTTTGNLTIRTGTTSGTRGQIILQGNGNINASTQKINNVVDPTSAQDAATKNYIDTNVSFKSAGDINETSFSIANNQSAAANVTGLTFANATVRSAQVLYSAFINATSSLYESGELLLVQKGSTWTVSRTAQGDNASLTFDVTNAGQVQYTSANYSGFTAGTLKFRAITTSV